MYISKKRLAVFIPTLILLLVEALYLAEFNTSSVSTDAFLSRYALIVVLNFFFQIAVMKYFGLNITSPIVMFIICCNIFHFGQLVANFFYQYNYLDYIRVYMIRDIPSLRRTLNVSINSINMTFLGVLIFQLFHQQRKSNTSTNIPLESEKCYEVGKWLFIISTPFRLFSDIRQLAGAVTLGYHGAIAANGVSGIITAIAGFWYSSILLMYIGRRNRPLFWGAVFYTVITMLTGGRGHQLINLIIMIMVYMHLSSRKISASKAVRFGILGYLMLMFIDMIMSFRSAGISAFIKNFGHYFSESLHSNILFETIGSFGETLFTPFLVVQQVGHQLHPFFGEAWIDSLFTIFPNIGGIFTQTNLHSNFPKMLITENAIGGSYVGDLYYNFRGAYWIAALIVGILLVAATVKYQEALSDKRYSKIIILIPIFFNSLWWVRDSIGNAMRPVVWQIVLSLLLLQIFNYRVREHMNAEV